MAWPTIVDTKMHGLDGVTAAFLIRARQTALIETGPKSSVDAVLAGLEQAEVERLDWIIVTHVHLDHAGAAGTLARRWPDATVAVHEVGAPHLANPAKLWSSARRIYGDSMHRLWGGIDPVSSDRIRPLKDGDKVDLGDRVLEAIDTPGHAYHHHAFLDVATGALFVGDALGVRLPDVGLVRPATPPPEFHLEKAVASIDRIRDIAPESLWLTHFGPHDAGKNAKSVGEICDEAQRTLRRWGDWVTEARRRTDDLDEVTAVVRERARSELEHELSEQEIDKMEQTTSYWMNAWGYIRYFGQFDAGRREGRDAAN